MRGIADRYDYDPFPPGSDFTDDTVLTVAVADAISGILFRHADPVRTDCPVNIPEDLKYLVVMESFPWHLASFNSRVFFCP
jgi:hypothetical protein